MALKPSEQHGGIVGLGSCHSASACVSRAVSSVPTILGAGLTARAWRERFDIRKIDLRYWLDKCRPHRCFGLAHRRWRRQFRDFGRRLDNLGNLRLRWLGLRFGHRLRCFRWRRLGCWFSWRDLIRVCRTWLSSDTARRAAGGTKGDLYAAYPGRLCPRIRSLPEHGGGDASMKHDGRDDCNHPMPASHPHQSAPSITAGIVSNFRRSTPASRRISMIVMTCTESVPLSAFSHTCRLASPISLFATDSSREA